MTPYFKACGPPAFSMMLPATVARCAETGSGEKHNPCGASANCRSELMTPGSTRARRFSTSMSRIWFRPDRSSRTRRAAGIIPPEQFDAPPRGHDRNVVFGGEPHDRCDVVAAVGAQQQARYSPDAPEVAAAFGEYGCRRSSRRHGRRRPFANCSMPALSAAVEVLRMCRVDISTASFVACIG